MDAGPPAPPRPLNTGDTGLSYLTGCQGLDSVSSCAGPRAAV